MTELQRACPGHGLVPRSRLLNPPGAAAGIDASREPGPRAPAVKREPHSARPSSSPAAGRSDSLSNRPDGPRAGRAPTATQQWPRIGWARDRFATVAIVALDPVAVTPAITELWAPDNRRLLTDDRELAASRLPDGRISHAGGRRPRPAGPRGRGSRARRRPPTPRRSAELRESYDPKVSTEAREAAGGGLWMLAQEPDVDPARVPEAAGAPIRRHRRRDRNRLDGVGDQPSPSR